MPKVAYIVRYRKDVFGNERSVFAFRRKADASIVCDNLTQVRSPIKVSNVNRKVHLLEKRAEDDELVKPVRVVSVDFEAFYHKTRVNCLEVNLVEFVIEEDAKLLLVSSSAMPAVDEPSLEDLKSNIEQLYRRK